MLYLDLLWGFLQVGCFSFGGAYAAIPLIRDVVLSYGWLSESQLAYMIAVSESTPGPLMVNMATYIGSSQAGLPGALIATAAVCLPAFLIILVIAAALGSLLKKPVVGAALEGLIPCITGIILATGIYMILASVVAVQSGVAPDWISLTLTAFLLLLMFGSGKLLKKQLSPIGLILIAALCGILFL